MQIKKESPIISFFAIHPNWSHGPVLLCIHVVMGWGAWALGRHLHSKPSRAASLAGDEMDIAVIARAKHLLLEKR